MSDKLLVKPGDIFLYRPVGFFGYLISIKTWHAISHVEVYDGGQQSLASRDGIGVGRYPTRLSQLCYILRPRVKLDLEAGRRWFETVKGEPYGWLDLLDFVDPFDLIPHGPGMVCSPFATSYLRACGWRVFPTDPPSKIAPFQFLDLIGVGLDVAYSPRDLDRYLAAA